MAATVQAKDVVHNPRVVCISLGGSALYKPQRRDQIDAAFIKAFVQTLERYPDRTFVIVTGGGPPARRSIDDISKLSCNTSFQDQVGILETRTNAFKLQVALIEAFGRDAVTPVIAESLAALKQLDLKRFTVSGGWEEGGTTDKDTVLAAEALGADSVINISNVAFIYTKDPRKRGAHPLRQLRYESALKIALRGDKRAPGTNFPLDNISIQLAGRARPQITIFMVGKQDLAGLQAVLEGRLHEGSVIGNKQALANARRRAAAVTVAAAASQQATAGAPEAR